MTPPPTINNDIVSETTTSPTTTVTILVLYGSQTGNSEQAAHDFCQACTSEHLYDIYMNNNKSSSSSSSTAANIPMNNIVTKCMSLDDFLYYETNHCNFHTSTILIVFVSSYGMGGPPLGAYRFREVCDCIMMMQKQDNTSNDEVTTKSKHSMDDANYNLSETAKSIVQELSFRNRIHYAICGLGDSRYTTYMNNPTVIDTTFRDYLQATPICDMGQADASSTSWKVSSTNTSTSRDNHYEKKEQADVIHEWIEQLWLPLSHVIYNNHTSAMPTSESLLQLQQQLIQLCEEIIPDFHPPHMKQSSSSSSFSSKKQSVSMNATMAMITIVMILISIIVAQYF